MHEHIDRAINAYRQAEQDLRQALASASLDPRVTNEQIAELTNAVRECEARRRELEARKQKLPPAIVKETWQPVERPVQPQPVEQAVQGPPAANNPA